MKYPNLSTTLCWLSAPLIFAMVGTGALASAVPGPLVETQWLSDHAAEVLILDVRKDAASYLGKPLGADEKPNLEKLTGHIPGAIFVPWKGVVSGSEEQGIPLKAMMPTPEAFSQLMQKSGVNNSSTIIVAGRGSTAKDQAYATRLYLTLKYFGHDKVAMLNGGTAQWAVQGRPLAYIQEEPVVGNFTVADVREQLLATTKDVERAIETGETQVLDCRTEDFYLGLNYNRKFVSPEHKGHLRGAKTLPFVLLSDNSGPAKFFSTEELRKVAEQKGVELNAPTITYCNTGVTASLGWYALHELLGNEQTKLYDGSMHAWSTMDPTHQVTSLAQEVGETAASELAESAAEGGMQGILPSRPRSLQSLVDERRDQLRKHRESLLDAYRTPGFAAYDDAVESYQDAMRLLYRQKRDYVRLQHDNWMDAVHPWSKSQRDWVRQQSYLMQMEQLDRQEYRDTYLYGERFAYGRPTFW